MERDAGALLSPIRIVDLFRFIDWVMTLPAGLERSLRREIEEFEEAQRMKYVYD